MVRIGAHLVLAAVLGGLATAPATVPAADSGPEVTWGVQPAGPGGADGRGAFDYQVPPGTLIEDWIAVTNYSSVPADFRLYAADAVTEYDTAQYTLIGAEEASTDLGAWTAVDAGPAECPDTDDQAEEECARSLGVRVTLEAGQTRTVPFAVTVPVDATPGDHSAGVVASFEQESADSAGNAVLMEQRVGARVYLRVDGPLAASVDVRGVTANYDSSWVPFGRGRATVGFDVANTGNVRLTGEPRVVLTGPFGIKLNTGTVAPVANLMPGGTGHVVAEFPRVWALFFLKAEVVVEPLPGDGDVGEEELELAAVGGSAVAWAVPWAGLVLVLVLGAGAWLVLRRRRGRRARRGLRGVRPSGVRWPDVPARGALPGDAPQRRPTVLGDHAEVHSGGRAEGAPARAAQPRDEQRWPEQPPRATVPSSRAEGHPGHRVQGVPARDAGGSRTADSVTAGDAVR